MLFGEISRKQVKETREKIYQLADKLAGHTQYGEMAGFEPARQAAICQKYG